MFAVSMFSLLAISVDRCWAVVYPLTYQAKSKSTTKKIIAACWSLGIFFGFLPALGWNSGVFHGKCDLRVVMNLYYLLFICVFIAFACSLVIIGLYIVIYVTILIKVN